MKNDSATGDWTLSPEWRAALVESSLDCVILMDAEGTILDVNTGVERTFGYDRAALIGRRLADVFVPPELRTRHEAGLRRYVQTGESTILGRRVEVEAIDVAGSRIPVELSIVPLRGVTPPIFVGHLRNISDRRRADRRLRLAAAAAHAVTESDTAAAAIEGVTRAIGEQLDWALVQFWRVDPHAAVLRKVHAWTSVSGLPEKIPAFALPRGRGLPGTAWERGRPVWLETAAASDMLLPRYDALVSNGLRGAFAFPIAVRHEVHGILEAFSLRIEPSDPELLALLDVIGGQLSHAVAMHEARESLERASAAKDQFLAMLSHELRTPLQPILGWAVLLEQPQLDDATRLRAAAAIRRNAEAETRLVEDLLDVSRIVTGKMTIERTLVSLVSVLQNSIDVVLPAATSKQIYLQFRGEFDAPLVIGDSKRLQQVFTNLLVNAVNFTPPHGAVDVSVEVTADDVRVSVKDTGQGIPPDLLPHIFERFRQGTRGVGFASPGLGLGLSIVRDLVFAHGGSVTAISDGLGKGATFVVRLPTI